MIYFRHLFTALSILIVCTSSNNLLPINSAQITGLGSINVHNNHNDDVGLLAIHTGIKKRSISPDGLDLFDTKKKRESRQKRFANHKKGDGFLIIHDEIKDSRDGLDPELAKLYKNHKEGDGLLAIWDGHIGDHIDPVLGELYKHHKKGDGLLSMHDVNDGHGTWPGDFDPYLLKLYKNHQKHTHTGLKSRNNEIPRFLRGYYHPFLG